MAAVVVAVLDKAHHSQALSAALGAVEVVVFNPIRVLFIYQSLGLMGLAVVVAVVVEISPEVRYFKMALVAVLAWSLYAIKQMVQIAFRPQAPAALRLLAVSTRFILLPRAILSHSWNRA